MRASVGLALGLLLLPAFASASAQAPLRDSASAFGHVLATDFVGASQAGPNGESPAGGLSLSGFLNFTTVTTCLNVSANAVVGGGRILTGRDAGRGFLSSSIDRGPPVNGRPVDVTVYSGLLPRPPRNCPSPGDAPPPQLSETGGGPFTRGDLVVVDAVERLPAAAPRARVRILGVVYTDRMRIRVRVCGTPGIALLRVRQRTTPPGRDAPVWLRGAWRDELRHDAPCQNHLLGSPIGSSSGARHRIVVRARTTGRRWSRQAAAVSRPSVPGPRPRAARGGSTRAPRG
jgi:hypothetical protein